jgi:formylglycine-generating enzyme required for sulfatase activity
VGDFRTDGYEMADMAGNVWEWTSSLWDPPQDGYRSMAGCSWANLEQDLATVWKTGYYPYTTHGTVGFRVIPEPATILLLTFGGITLRLRSGQVLRKKRR